MRCVVAAKKVAVTKGPDQSAHPKDLHIDVDSASHRRMSLFLKNNPATAEVLEDLELTPENSVVLHLDIYLVVC